MKSSDKKTQNIGLCRSMISYQAMWVRFTLLNDVCIFFLGNSMINFDIYIVLSNFCIKYRFKKLFGYNCNFEF